MPVAGVTSPSHAPKLRAVSAFPHPFRPPAIRRSLPWLIAGLSMIGPFSIDTYLPSFREMETSLGASAVEIQQSLTAFLLPFALMSLWHGSISDALGRRRVILVALAIMALASAGCALAPSIHVLWLLRAVQGIAAGAGLVVGRAVIRDVYAGAQAQRVMATVTVIFTIAPALAPILGGWLHEWFGWRSVFVFLALFALAVLVWAAFDLPETLHHEQRHSLQPRFLFQSYLRALTDPRFLAAAFAAAFNFTAIFLYVTSAPVFLLQHLHLHETQFYWLFLPITAGMMLGSALSGRLAGRISPRRTVALGYAGMILAAAVNLGFHLLQPAALPWSVAPLLLYAIGMSLAMPSLVLFGLDIFPAQKGLASSCQTFLMTMLNTLTAGVLSPLANASPLRLALVSAALTGTGLLCAAVFFRARAPAAS